MRISRMTIPILATALAFTAVPLAQNDAARSGETGRRRGHGRGDGRSTPRTAEDRRRQGRGLDEGVHAADGGFHLQLRGARLSGDRDQPVPDRHPEEERLQRAGRHRGNSHRVHGDVGIGQAGHRARVGHRRHPAGVAEARRRVSLADDRGRAGPRRRPQLGTGGERHGGARREEDHGAREAPGHDPHLARHRRGARGHEGVLRARRLLQGRRRRAVHARRQRAGRVVGRPHRDGARLGRIHLHGSDRAFGGRTVARPQRARRRRADEHRLELPARAPAARAPLALRHHRRRRSAERRAAHRVGLVLLQAHDVSQDQGAVGDRRRHREGRRDDDEHRARRRRACSGARGRST